MFTIDKYNKMKLTQGDTATILIEVYDLDNNKYNVTDEDEILMTVKKTATAPIAFQKAATQDCYIIINPADTQELKTGLYVYDVQLTTKTGAVYTIVPESYFEITPQIGG